MLELSVTCNPILSSKMCCCHKEYGISVMLLYIVCVVKSALTTAYFKCTRLDLYHKHCYCAFINCASFRDFASTSESRFLLHDPLCRLAATVKAAYSTMANQEQSELRPVPDPQRRSSLASQSFLWHILRWTLPKQRSIKDTGSVVQPISVLHSPFWCFRLPSCERSGCVECAQSLSLLGCLISSETLRPLLP